MITKIISEEKIQEVSECIEKGDSFAIVSHVSPDGDSLGASLALSRFLASYEKENIQVIVPDNFPSFYKWMPGCKDIMVYEKDPGAADTAIAQADIIFCLDFNDPKRLGKMASAVLDARGCKVMIDHHPNPADFCDVEVSYPRISSTSEMIFRIICRMELFELVDKETAECIYTGMMTDTGSFTYNSNNPEVYVIVSELIKKEINKDEIYRRVNQVYSESRMRLMGYALCEKMKIYPDKKTALITLTRDELKRFNYHPGDTENFVNLPLNIKGISFAAFIRGDADPVKLSFRSTGEYPVNQFAAEYFAGGGHKNASGGEYDGTMAEAIAAFEKGLSKHNPNLFEK